MVAVDVSCGLLVAPSDGDAGGDDGSDGVAVGLAAALAQRLGATLAVRRFSSAGEVVASSGSWAVAFIADDPARRQVISHTTCVPLRASLQLEVQQLCHDSSIRCDSTLPQLCAGGPWLHAPLRAGARAVPRPGELAPHPRFAARNG